MASARRRLSVGWRVGIAMAVAWRGRPDEDDAGRPASKCQSLRRRATAASPRPTALLGKSEAVWVVRRTQRSTMTGASPGPKRPLEGRSG